ncbi:MAG: hypothetical protein COW85_02545 [Ignavibacteria bacterium CG22_combo_CG10-13_8_21_14_all_37_15]|nr:MAG: hypothetical protein COW85_02545 [Ignavibacteria bacterium CG22_combo_CG10-13_8_21_14_all_37_15]
MKFLPLTIHHFFCFGTHRLKHLHLFFAQYLVCFAIYGELKSFHEQESVSLAVTKPGQIPQKVNTKYL